MDCRTGNTGAGIRARPAHPNAPPPSILAVGVAIKRDENSYFDHPVCHGFGLADHQLQNRGVGRERLIAVDHRLRSPAASLSAVFFCRDHCLIRSDPCFAVHRERIGIGGRGKWGRIDSQVSDPRSFRFRSRSVAPADSPDRRSGMIGATIRAKFQIPPPFLGVVQPAIAHRLSSRLAPTPARRRGMIGRCPSERRLGKQALKIPRAGFHATPTHRTARLWSSR